MRTTRRELLMMGAAASVLATAKGAESRIAMEAYIWQQYAQHNHKALKDVLSEVIPMAKTAGFTNVELNQEFLTPELRGETIALVKKDGLRLPSVYVGGVMHTSEGAKDTITRALEIAKVCKPFGCVAVVHNPSPKPKSEAKTDDELKLQSESLNQLGHELKNSGFELRVHHHTPEMADNAREWRYILHTTDPKYVSLCIDVDWVRQGDQDPLAILKEAGKRVKEIHVRNSKDKMWLETVDDGDVDYGKVAEYFHSAHLEPLIVVELAYKPGTKVTRPLVEDLRLGRVYTEKVFGVS